MPLTDVELSRLADTAAALRPDFVARSVRTILARDLRDRAFADVAVAMAACYADPATTTPGRLVEPGPWWQATRANRPGAATFVPGPGPDARCTVPGHEHERAAGCRACRADEVAAEVDEPDPPAEAVPELLGALQAAVERARARKLAQRPPRRPRLGPAGWQTPRQTLVERAVVADPRAWLLANLEPLTSARTVAELDEELAFLADLAGDTDRSLHLRHRAHELAGRIRELRDQLAALDDTPTPTEEP